tara:strand:+ start:1204 stop:1425 length:222 start_codon:yes stop_codon:yes gene_type:complete
MAFSSMAKLREARNAALTASDFYMLPDYEDQMPALRSVAVGLYRQALRDFPATLTAADDGSYDLSDVDLPVLV